MNERAIPPGALVVDDDDAIRTSMSLYARAAGLQAVTARDGRDALDALSCGFRPAVIVTDVDMPRLNGLELLAHVRASAALSSTPVVVFSRRPEPKPGVDADAWLDKSQVDALIGTLHTLVKRGRAGARPTAH